MRAPPRAHGGLRGRRSWMLVVGAVLIGVGGATYLLLGADPATDPGPKSVPQAPSYMEFVGPKWSNVAPEQLAEAERLGVPVALVNQIGMRFLLIPGGTFLMGSSETEPGRDSDEGPQHMVTVAPFYLSIHETTNRQYRRFRPNHRSGAYNRSKWPGRDLLYGLDADDQPALMMSHQDATEFAVWLSREHPGGPPRVHRLPSEAEWEYACRAGTTTLYFWGETAGHWYANINDVRASKELPLGHAGWKTADGALVTARVGSLLPNRWHLYDMLGNAFEWCEDDYHPSYFGAPIDGSAWVEHPERGRLRVLRGGSWGSPPRWARAAFRAVDHPSLRHDELGVRLAVSLPAR